MDDCKYLTDQNIAILEKAARMSVLKACGATP